MRPMSFARVVLILAIVGSLSACSDGGDCFDSIDEFIPPDAPNGTDAGGGGGGQCAAWVEIGGVDFNWYRDMRFEGWEFRIDPDELDVYEELATEATHLVNPVAEATVWSVRELDSDVFLVMRSAPDREYFFIVKGESGVTTPDVEAVLCRYATGTESTIEQNCRAPEEPGG